MKRLSPEQLDRWQRFQSSGWDFLHGMRSYTDSASELTHSEWRLLGFLENSTGLRISDLSTATRIGMSTVSRQVNKLIQAGYARVDGGSRGDARQKWVKITDAGREVLDTVAAARDRGVLDLVFEVLSDDEFLQLMEMYERLGIRARLLLDGD
ncbi:MarR family winged helix-turn-helix transcriptional regulator [Gordonia hirsuta]|uniref:MarR family winged helix-turn-helix transcriptional regulator n=1 Tax=Gordonia hirsuta TaxID=53427 RepID=UPI0012DD1661|nr:MarR family transcriptional regulator [Gordonia hirsuta]